MGFGFLLPLKNLRRDKLLDESSQADKTHKAGFRTNYYRSSKEINDEKAKIRTLAVFLKGTW